MKHNEDDFLENLSSSKEESETLKEIISLLSNMEPVQSSPSFQNELKSRLLSPEMPTPVSKSNKGKKNCPDFLKNWRQRYGIRPFVAVAAAFILVISLSLFYSESHPGEKGPAMTAQEEPASSPSEPGGEPIIQEIGEQEAGTNTPEPKLPGFSESPGPEEQGPEKEIGPQPDPPPPEIETGIKDVPGKGEEGLIISNKPGEEEKPREEPRFEIWEKRRTLKLAAEIKLPCFYYQATANDQDLVLAEAGYAWRPGGKFIMTINGEGQDSIESKVEGKLSEKGFRVEGAYLKINDLQETPRGVFAEFFFKSKKGHPDDPLLVAYYEEGKDIISYYYEEKGKAAEPGFYPLLSPVQAFEHAKEAKVYASTPLLRFSFQEVNLTYYDFLLGDSGQEKAVKLPAYCFTGMETGRNGKEFKLYLPAIPR